MNDLWIIGAAAAATFFAVVEVYALRHPDRQNTLSRALFTLGQKWPLSIWLLGLLTGAVAAHLFWHWCPAGAFSLG